MKNIRTILLIIFIELVKMFLVYLYHKLKLYVYLYYVKFTNKKIKQKQLSKEVEEQMKKINDKYNDL